MKKNKKIINDPVYGFITITSDLVFQLIEHPYFQRLRRIKQLGLTDYIYPGALHTRFQHALGAVHLMKLAIETLKSKGHEITNEETEASYIAILLHDIGHGPFSHALENTIIEGLTHEDLSDFFMRKMNEEFDGKLQMAIDIFQNTYKKHFLHQLVSSQLDVDRLDYLRRDSFFSGVSEGTIGLDRIIQMIDVVNDEIVIEAKGIYSIEKFLISRRLMYWQVYLHKAVLSAEHILMLILIRAKELTNNGQHLFASPYLNFFLQNSFTKEDLNKKPEQIGEILSNFACLDDSDIISSAKVWMNHPDETLAYLCKNLINRELYTVELNTEPFNEEAIQSMRDTVCRELGIPSVLSKYYVYSTSIMNYAYKPDSESIKILMKDGELKNISETSDMLKMSMLSQGIKRFIVCYPKRFKKEFKNFV